MDPSPPTERYLQLKSRIVSGAIAAGERLTEAGVSEILGIGRGPAREALQRLELEGLVLKKGLHGRRYVHYLEDIDPQTLEFQFEVREALDGLAARDAALNMTGRQVNELRGIAAEVARGVNSNRAMVRMQALGRFYDFLRRHCGNPLVIRAISGAGISSYFTRNPELDRRLVQVMKEDRRKKIDLVSVVESIALHDPQLAETRMRAWTRSMARAVCGS
jgi:DNA-binding GntR family transcriptional regulator